MASSLRNIGLPADALHLLEREARQPPDELAHALAAFRALVIRGLGRGREALGLALDALSNHLPRYNASLRRYASELHTDANPEAGDGVEQQAES